MAKRRLKLHFRLPEYAPPRNHWRQLIHARALASSRAAGITYLNSDALQVSVVLYLNGNALHVHDVDNRLKDILDALQERMGGPKSRRSHPPVIPNDRQIYRVTITKLNPPAQSHGQGHVTVSRARTAQPQLSS